MINDKEQPNDSVIFYTMDNPTPIAGSMFILDDKVNNFDNPKKEFFSPLVTIVAIKDNKFIGQVYLHQIIIKCTDKILKQLALSLYCIDSCYINHDIGSDLTKKACEKAHDMGYKAVFLRGNPMYFSQFGFVPTHVYNLYPISDPSQKSDWCMVKELVAGYLETIEKGSKIQFE